MLLESYLYLLVNKSVNHYEKGLYHDFYFVIAHIQHICNLRVYNGEVTKSGYSSQHILFENEMGKIRAESPKAYSPGQRPG